MKDLRNIRAELNTKAPPLLGMHLQYREQLDEILSLTKKATELALLQCDYYDAGNIKKGDKLGKEVQIMTRRIKYLQDAIPNYQSFFDMAHDVEALEEQKKTLESKYN